MTQASWIILALKVACVTGVLSLTGWVVQYHLYTHGKWRKNPIGRTLVTKTLLIAALLVPTALSLFFHFNRLTSYAAGWIDAVLIFLITPVMLWRMAVWHRLHKEGRDGTGGGEPG